MHSRSPEPITAAELRRLAGLRCWTFFALAPERPYPDAALFRRRKIADFGRSKFGRTATAPTWVEGRRVDLFARSLDVPRSADPAEAITEWLRDGRTRSAARLAEKAVIEIDPVPGRIIWTPLSGGQGILDAVHLAVDHRSLELCDFSLGLRSDGRRIAGR